LSGRALYQEGEKGDGPPHEEKEGHVDKRRELRDTPANQKKQITTTSEEKEAVFALNNKKKRSLPPTEESQALFSVWKRREAYDARAKKENR